MNERGSGLLLCLTLALGSSACAMDGSEPAGSIEIPLSQPADDGSIYYLRNAMFDITSPGQPPIVINDDGDETVIVSDVSPGTYDVQLGTDWRIEQSTDGGVTRTVVPDAVLASRNPQRVHVGTGFQEEVHFNFLLGSPNGTIALTFGVQKSWKLAISLLAQAITPDGAFSTVKSGDMLELAVLFPAGSTSVSGMTRTVSLRPAVLSFFNAPAVLARTMTSDSSIVMAPETAPDGTTTLTGIAPFSLGGDRGTDGAIYTIDFGGGDTDWAPGPDGAPPLSALNDNATFTLRRSVSNGDTLVETDHVFGIATIRLAPTN